MRRLACILGLLLVVGGCKIEKVEPPTQDPIIVSLRVSSYLVSPGGYTEILAWASDPDLQDDTLYYEWSVEPQDGKFTDTTDTNETNTANPIRWWPETPRDTNYVIHLKVTDGRGGEAETTIGISVSYYTLVKVIGEGELDMPFGLNVEEEEIWVVDPSQKLIFVFDMNGNKKAEYTAVVMEVSEEGDTSYIEIEPYDIEIGDTLYYVASVTGTDGKGGTYAGKLNEKNGEILLTVKYPTGEANAYVQLRENSSDTLLIGKNDGNNRLAIVDLVNLNVKNCEIAYAVAGGIANDGKKAYQTFYYDTLTAGVKWVDLDDPDSTYGFFYTSLHNPKGIGYDPVEKLLYVGDAPPGDRNIVVLKAEDGSVEEIFGTLGDAPDQLNMPTDIEIKNGYIYVVDMGNRVIKVFRKK